jgi:hypothetical protein
MAEKFDKAKHKKGDILQDAVRALGVDAPNDGLKTWINERFQGFPWAGNPSAELANAKKSVGKEMDAEEPIKPEPVKAPKAKPSPVPVPAATPTASESAPAVTSSALIKALKRIAAMPADERAALDKALKAIEQFGTAEAAQIAIKKVTDLMA